MTGERYECVCHSCTEDRLIDELRRAQEYFNEHAAQGCEVVLRNVSSVASPDTTESTYSDSTVEKSKSAEE